jgi:hypothetical protein
LRSHIRKRLLAARRGEPLRQRHFIEIGTQRDVQRHGAIAQDRLAQWRRQRINRAALDTGRSDNGLAANDFVAKR